MAQDVPVAAQRSAHVEVVDAVAAGEHAVDHGQQLWRPRAGRAAQADQLVGGRLDAEPLGQGAGSSSPALATAWWSSKQTWSWSRVGWSWLTTIEKVPSCAGPMDV